MKPFIELGNVTFQRGTKRVLDSVSLSVFKGELLAIVGPSGSGKTTILRIILGLLEPSEGTIKMRGETLSEAARIIVPPESRNLGMVFQDLALWPHLTVRGNLLFGLKAKHVPKKTRESLISNTLDLVGLKELENKFPGELSGGEQQRVALARALVMKPDVILFDEPMSNLDIALKSELFELVGRILRQQKTTTIYVTHEPREAARLADRIAIVENGRVVQTGTENELSEAPATPFVQMFVDETHAIKPLKTTITARGRFL